MKLLEQDVAEIKQLLGSPESCPSPRKQRFQVRPPSVRWLLLLVWKVLTFPLNLLPDGGAEGPVHEDQRGSDPEEQTGPVSSWERRGDSERLCCGQPAPDSAAGPGEGPGLGPNRLSLHLSPSASDLSVFVLQKVPALFTQKPLSPAQSRGGTGSPPPVPESSQLEAQVSSITGPVTIETATLVVGSLP